MPEKTAAEKMRLKPRMRIAPLFDEHGVAGRLGTDRSVTFTDTLEDADAVLLFATDQLQFEGRFAALLPQITRDVAFWIVYPKGSKAAGRDISRDTIWPVVEAAGFRPIGMVSVDDTWSGFRVRPSA